MNAAFWIIVVALLVLLWYLAFPLIYLFYKYLARFEKSLEKDIEKEEEFYYGKDDSEQR